MASIGVRIGHGSRVRIGVGATPTYTTLTGTKDFTLPEQVRADVDVTSHDSPEETEEYIRGLRASTDWTLEKDFVAEDAEDVLLSGLEASGATVILEILPAGATVPLAWTGYVKNWTAGLPVKDAMRATLTMRINARVVE